MVSEFGYASSTADRISSELRGGSTDAAREDSPLSEPSILCPILESLRRSPSYIEIIAEWYITGRIEN